MQSNAFSVKAAECILTTDYRVYYDFPVVLSHQTYITTKTF